jgi:hypothetical protein
VPARVPLARSIWPRSPKETAMQTERPDTNLQANAELARSFEPLRIVFALSALLLGLIATLRF